jgi:hypothetical protein
VFVGRTQARFIAALNLFGYAPESFKNSAGHIIDFIIYEVHFKLVFLTLTGKVLSWRYLRRVVLKALAS